MSSAAQLIGLSPFVWTKFIPAVLGVLVALFVATFLLLVVVLTLVQQLTGIIGSPTLSTSSSHSRKGKHVLVTGGSSGIGLEVARIYLNQGCRVTIVARNKAKLAEAQEDLKKFYKYPSKFEDNFLAISLDVGSDEATVKTGLAPAINKFGDVDILVNSAGTSVAGTFETLDSKEFERMYRINVLGSIYPTRVVLPAMKQKKHGKIIFVSSQVAQAAIYGYTAYGASKWAIRGLAEALQMEVKPYNISVSVSYPPDTDTPGYKEEMLTKPVITKKISETGSVFSPVDVAATIVNESDQNKFTISTGSDGLLLKQLHPGMTPLNNVVEVAHQILFASIFRFVAVIYLSFWDYLVSHHLKQEQHGSKDDKKKQ